MPLTYKKVRYLTKVPTTNNIWEERAIAPPINIYHRHNK